MGLLATWGVTADMLPIALALVLLSGLHAAPVEKALKKSIASCKDCAPTADGLTALDEGGDQPIAERVMGGEEAEDPAAAGADIDLLEDEDEAIGDRIMEDMNGMKDKFDTALERIGDEIDKDQAEQNEKNAGQ